MVEEKQLKVYGLMTGLLCLLSSCQGFKYLQSELPNGASVPHPCKPGEVWEGVAHYSPQGGGARNAFGVDFEAAGKKWTKELCMYDSDGDGLTNGQELGDPECVWKKGETPTRVTELSHPGVCDLWNSPVCFTKLVPGTRYSTQEEWLKEVCAADGLDCPAINEPGMKTAELRLPHTPVPAKETTYICQMVEMPEGDFHITATEPIVNNSYILHHIVLFGCQDDQEFIKEPFECDMLPTQKCKSFASVWSLGIPGSCYDKDSGVSIGQKGFKKMALQFHWFNPEEKAGYYDSSGMLIHYTENKRPHEVGVLLTGSVDFFLPPHKPSLWINSSCTEKCTRDTMKDQSIYISSAWNHMHYAGISMSIKVKRNNKVVQVITDEPIFNYDSPQLATFDPPFEFLPGDELVTNCEFQTMDRNKTTYFGEATLDEMCFGIITYHPRENFSPNLGYCFNQDNMVYCDPATYEDCPKLYQLRSEELVKAQPFYQDIMADCEMFYPCLEECVNTILHHREINGCLKGNNWKMIQRDLFKRHQAGMDLLNRINSCAAQLDRALN